MQFRFIYTTLVGFMFSASMLAAQTGASKHTSASGTACIFGDNAFQLGMTISVSGLNYTCKASPDAAVWEQTEVSGVPLCLANGELHSLRSMVSAGLRSAEVFSFCNSIGAWQRVE
ncbi:MAG: hypothetical protein AAGF22_01820 [Pseudomonadota bacterium]